MKHLIDYALLRSVVDKRPLWAIKIGVHSVLINNNELKVQYPRLRFKKKVGSHVVNPYADPNYIREQEYRFESYYKNIVEEFNTAMV